MIRHASRRVTLPVGTLPVAMIEPALQIPGGAGWQRGVADVELPCGKSRCNSAARGRSANKSRTPSDIPGCDKPRGSGRNQRRRVFSGVQAS